MSTPNLANRPRTVEQPPTGGILAHEARQVALTPQSALAIDAILLRGPSGSARIDDTPPRPRGLGLDQLPISCDHRLDPE